ncbi:alpha-ketoglutarate-dependent dioxygenase alkB homolog 7, mitochondrial-like [Halichondria panicea]|uniref:alpha-ketoglutarate-dependent dioxygenase alkB homolog 7, mitochondrial-like n=1 Tax=Halichondria panicea TaxID=6063 RepID=UPI00312B2CAB
MIPNVIRRVEFQYCKLHFLLRTRPLSHVMYSGSTGLVTPVADPSLLDCSRAAAQDVDGFAIISNFVSSEEEEQLMVDIRRTLRGRKYLYDHWDGAIEGYSETEKSNWSESNTPVIQRLKAVAAAAVTDKVVVPLEQVHVLDLAEDGHIKPHVDSVKFCGEVICGISLLSDSVMQLQHEEYPDRWIHALLSRFSLYIMRGVIRYKYTHAIPTNENSVFKGERITKQRRVSVISRTQPVHS